MPRSRPRRFYAKDCAELDRMNAIDGMKLNPRRPEYIDRFNREVKV